MSAESQHRMIENWPWRDRWGRYLDARGNPIIQARPLKLPDGSWALWCSKARVGEHVRVKLKSGTQYFAKVVEIIESPANSIRPGETIIRAARKWTGASKYIRGHVDSDGDVPVEA